MRLCTQLRQHGAGSAILHPMVPAVITVSTNAKMELLATVFRLRHGCNEGKIDNQDSERHSAISDSGEPGRRTAQAPLVMPPVGRASLAKATASPGFW